MNEANEFQADKCKGGKRVEITFTNAHTLGFFLPSGLSHYEIIYNVVQCTVFVCYVFK